MSKVVTMERMRRVAVTVSHREKDKREKDKQIEQTVLDAYHNHQPVVIYYRDAKGKRTTMMVEPHDLETNLYTGGLWVKAYCYLRDADRTFLLDRIIDAIPADTDLSVVSCPSS